MRTRKKYKGVHDPRPVPPGFAPKEVDGRIVYSAKRTPMILAHHESLMQELCERRGVHKISLPDQLDCIRPHLWHRYYLKLDLAKAFDAVDPFCCMVALDLPEDVERFWKYYFHRDGGLIQGAPMSTILFHLYMQEVVDTPLDVYAHTHGLTYTRYVDDLLFSSCHKIRPDVIGELTTVLRLMGFAVNRRKTRLLDSRVETLEYLGMRIHRRTVDVMPEVHARIAELESASNYSSFTMTMRRSLEQSKLWRDRILALNHGRRYNARR